MRYVIGFWCGGDGRSYTLLGGLHWLSIPNLAGDDSYDFGFDFWCLNAVRDVGTNSSLQLVQDAEGAWGEYVSGTLYIDFFSWDWQDESADVVITAWSEGGDKNFDIGTIHFDATYSNPDYHFTHDFEPDALAAFASEGWGNVNITATVVGEQCWGDNDFAIKKVAVEVNTAEAPVPEPATMVLLGFGLLGLVGLRKRFKR